MATRFAVHAAMNEKTRQVLRSAGFSLE